MQGKKYTIRGFHTEEDVYYKIGESTDIIAVTDDKETALKETMKQHKDKYFMTLVREGGRIVAFARDNKMYHVTHINPEAKKAISKLHHALDWYDMFVIINKDGKTNLRCEKFFEDFDPRSKTIENIFNDKTVGSDVEAVKEILESLQTIIPEKIASVTINVDYISPIDYLSLKMFYTINEDGMAEVFYRHICEGGWVH